MNKAFKTFQKFLKDQGYYQGEVDGDWGPLSVNAMKGYAFNSSCGHPDGSPFDGSRPAPEGLSFQDGALVAADKAPEKETVVETKTDEPVQQKEEQAKEPPAPELPVKSGSFRVSGSK